MSRSIGRYTYGYEGIIVYNWGDNYGVKVGAFCSIGTNCRIYTGGNHCTSYITTYPFGIVHKEVFTNPLVANRAISNGDVVIGNDVWIGNDVTIMSGVKVGDGAVIAANSHVVKDVLPYTIVGGNPARLIRERFPPEQVAALLRLKWWDWPDEKINKYCHLLCSSRIETLLELTDDTNA